MMTVIQMRSGAGDDNDDDNDNDHDNDEGDHDDGKKKAKAKPKKTQKSTKPTAAPSRESERITTQKKDSNFTYKEPGGFRGGYKRVTSTSNSAVAEDDTNDPRPADFDSDEECFDRWHTSKNALPVTADSSYFDKLENTVKHAITDIREICEIQRQPRYVYFGLYNDDSIDDCHVMNFYDITTTKPVSKMIAGEWMLQTCGSMLADCHRIMAKERRYPKTGGTVLMEKRLENIILTIEPDLLVSSPTSSSSSSS